MRLFLRKTMEYFFEKGEIRVLHSFDFYLLIRVDSK